MTVSMAAVRRFVLFQTSISARLDIGDPKNRLAHGRVAQALLVALVVTVAKDHFLDTWRRRHQHQPDPVAPAGIPEDLTEPFRTEHLLGVVVNWPSVWPDR